MMKRLTKVLIGLAALLGTALQSDTVQQYLAAVLVPLLTAHPKLSAAAAAISVILALAHNPKPTQ